MGHWWVPGLVIGYEHSFVHAVADFLKGLETGVPAQPDFARIADAEGVRGGAALGESGHGKRQTLQRKETRWQARRS